jgi:hypothetical protein
VSEGVIVGRCRDESVTGKCRGVVGVPWEPVAK